MKLNWMMVALVAGVMAVSGCKKDKKKDEPTGGSTATGSSMAGSSMAGSSMAGSGMANPTEGSGGTMAGSGATMSGSGATMTGSGATMTGSGGAAASMSDADIEKLINDVIGMMTDIGKGMAGKDCAGAAAAITSVLDAKKDVVDKIAALENDDSIEDRAEKIMEAKGLEKQLDEAMKPIEETGQKCESDAAFTAAGDRLKAVLK